jgi:phage terminase large subunit
MTAAAQGGAIVLDYKPFQPFKAFHARKQRYAYMVCTRRAGKTVAVVNDMVARAMRTKMPNARFGYFAPTMKQGVRAAWDYFKFAVEKIPGVKIHETAKTIDLPNGARIELYSGEDPHSIRGGRWDGAVLDEYGDMKSIVWTQVVRPGLADRKGWVVFIGTPRGKNAFYRMRQRAIENKNSNWFYLSVTAQDIVDNGGPKTGWGVWTQTELDECRLDATDEDEFRQEYMCDFEATNRGSYYGKLIVDLERNGQLVFDDRNPLYDPSYPVSLSHDPGQDDAWAIWFWQVIDGEVRFIDYWEETGRDAEEVADVLELKPYAYETWWVPHDALHKTAQSKKSILDTFIEHDAPARKVPNPDAGNRVIHGVNAVRRCLRTFPFRFDAIKCKRGLEALRNYSRKWNQDSQVFSDIAKHDEWSHGADSFRYACLSITREAIARSVEEAARRRPKEQQKEALKPVTRTFKQALDAHVSRLNSIDRRFTEIV